MAWTALTFGFASKLTSVKMTDLYNNAGAAASAGDYIENQTGSNSGTTTTYTKYLEIKVHRGGTYRVRLALSPDSGTAFARVYVNGVAQGVELMVVGTGFVYQNDDLVVASGDLIQLYTRTSSGTTPNTRKLAVMTGNPVVPSNLYTLDELRL